MVSLLRRYVLFALLMITASAQTPSDWIDQLAAPGVPDQVRWQAALELGNWSWQDPTQRDQAVEALVAALNTPEVGLRTNAATALGRIGDPRAVPALSRALGDPSALVRQAAAQALGRIGTPEAAFALLRALSDPDLRVRVQAVRALGRTGQPMAAEPLVELLKQTAETAPELRQELIEALARLGGFAVDPLLRAVQVRRPAVRQAAAEALGRLGDPRAVPTLVKMLSDPNSQSVAAAAYALGRLGEPAITPLLERLDHPDSRVRRAAALALAGIGEPAVAPLQGNYNRFATLLAQLQGELRQAQLAEEQRLRGGVPSAPEPSAPEPAARPVPTTYSELQRELRTLKKDLRRLNEEREATERLALYRWAEEEFQRRIVRAQELAASPPETPVTPNPYLLSLTPAPVPPTEQPLDLEPLPPEPGTPARPSTQIQREIEAVREKIGWVLTALGEIGTDRAVQALAAVVQGGEAPEAAIAALALGQTRNPAALPVLQTVAQEITYPTSVRANAVRSLGTLGDPSVRAFLLNLWQNDPVPAVRQAAREALDRLGPTAQTPAP